MENRRDMKVWATILAAGAAFASANGVAQAQVFHCVITPVPAGGSPASSMSSTLNGAATFHGTLIGNYDPVTNPGGTRTLNYSIFGTRPPPPTNISKNLNGNGSATGNSTGAPVGSYDLSLALSPPGGTVTLTALSSNLVGAATPATFPINATVSYQSFLTANPNYSYPFLVPIPIALGTASLTSMTLTQTAPASGPLAAATGGRYTFSLSVPAIVAATVDFQGTPTTQSQPQTLTVTGSVTPGASTALASLTVALNFSQVNNIPQPQPPNQPFDMPDPANASNPPAHLLLSLTIDTQNIGVNGSSTLPALGAFPVNVCGSTDFNGDGDVGTDQDIEAFFACLAGNCCHTCGTADFNGDGDVGTDQDIEAFFRVLAGGTC